MNTILGWGVAQWREAYRIHEAEGRWADGSVSGAIALRCWWQERYASDPLNLVIILPKGASLRPWDDSGFRLWWENVMSDLARLDFRPPPPPAVTRPTVGAA